MSQPFDRTLGDTMKRGIPCDPNSIWA